LQKSTDVLEQCTAFIIRVDNRPKQENGTNQMASTATLVASCLAYSLTLKMEAVCSSDTLVHFYRTTKHYIPEDGTTVLKLLHTNIKIYSPVLNYLHADSHDKLSMPSFALFHCEHTTWKPIPEHHNNNSVQDFKKGQIAWQQDNSILGHIHLM
jgi:hypothetical protein